MTLRPTFRARPSWKPKLRNKFALKAKPRSRGISRKETSGQLLGTAAGRKAGRRVNPKRETPRAVHSERTEHITGHRRVRLKNGSPERAKRRAEIFERAGGRCEEIIRRIIPTQHIGKTIWFTVRVVKVRCPNPATQWSHKKHAANKCDCYSPTAEGACSIASCDECHEKIHRPKACPKKERAA